jgi:hypothetical protein
VMFRGCGSSGIVRGFFMTIPRLLSYLTTALLKRRAMADLSGQLPPRVAARTYETLTFCSLLRTRRTRTIHPSESRSPANVGNKRGRFAKHNTQSSLPIRPPKAGSSLIAISLLAPLSTAWRDGEPWTYEGWPDNRQEVERAEALAGPHP